MGSAGAKAMAVVRGRGRDLPPFRRPVRVGQLRAPVAVAQAQNGGLHMLTHRRCAVGLQSGRYLHARSSDLPPEWAEPGTGRSRSDHAQRLTARAPSPKATITRWCSATNGAAIGDVARWGKAAPGFWRSASGGGSLEQLMLLRPTLANYDIRFATTEPAVAGAARHCDGRKPARLQPEQAVASALCAMAALWVVVKLRPQVIPFDRRRTGAFFCILAGRLIGRVTLWIDSVANGEELSMCGKLSRRFAHECWTQWEHLAEGDTPALFRAVL